MDDWETARRMLREYGNRAEEECAARAAYHRMQGDNAEAEQWQKLKTNLAVLRLRS